MTKKATSIVAYITVIGWLIAWLAGDREGAKVHLNNGLVLVLGTLVNIVIGWVPIVGWILRPIINVVIFVYMIIGIVYAAENLDKELPLVGNVKILQ